MYEGLQASSGIGVCWLVSAPCPAQHVRAGLCGLCMRAEADSPQLAWLLLVIIVVVEAGCLPCVNLAELLVRLQQVVEDQQWLCSCLAL
jgi:hypothetical protein